VDRDNVLNCFGRAFARPHFDPMKKLDVSFVDNFNEPEGAADNGGPSREFFRLLLHEVSTCEVFCDADGQKQLVLSTGGT